MGYGDDICTTSGLVSGIGGSVAGTMIGAKIGEYMDNKKSEKLYYNS